MDYRGDNIYLWAADVRRRRGLSPATKVVADAIATSIALEGNFAPSQRELAEACGISARTVRAAVADLKGFGLITVETGSGWETSRYALITPPTARSARPATLTFH